MVVDITMAIENDENWCFQCGMVVDITMAIENELKVNTTNDFYLKIQVNTVWRVIFEVFYFWILLRTLLLQKLTL